MTREQKLERWAERELRHSIDKMILDDNSGGWVVFGKVKMLVRPGRIWA